MSAKRKHTLSASWLFKRMPPRTKNKMWLKTLASKKKFLAEKSNISWKAVTSSTMLSDSQEDISSEDKMDNSPAVVVEVPHRSKRRLQSSSVFEDQNSASTLFTSVESNHSRKKNRLVNKPTRHRDFSDDSKDTEESDVIPEELSDGITLATSDSSKDDSDSLEILEDEVPEDEDITDKIQVFEEEKIVVVVLRHPVEIILCGRALVRTISGSVSIFGYQLNNKNPGPVQIFSSSNFSYLTLKTEEPEKFIEAMAHSRYIKYRLAQMQAQKISSRVLSAVNQDSVVIAFCQAPEVGSVQYACHLSFNLFKPPVLHNSMFAQPMFTKYGFTLMVDSSCQKLVMKEDQEELAEHIVNTILQAQSLGSSAPRIVVCGGKNVGKSTFLRFVMNKTLNVCEKILHLEGDPGQTEFTPPGCVSLTSVCEPLLGPPFTHSRTPERMCYVGGINVENSPDLYSSSMQHLLQYQRNHLANHPLFINTMGWTTGLGLSLLVDILRVAQPTIIVQFDCGLSQMSHNLPTLNSSFLVNACGWRSSRELLNVTKSDLRVLSPPDEQRTLAKCVVPSVTSRNLAIFSYMGKLQRPHLEFQPINGFTPYSVPWSAVAVHSCHEEVPPEQVMHAVNGTIVALCRIDNLKMIDSTVPDYPKCLTENPENICLGFGLIRGIDYQKKLFLVITPEKLPSLQEVNAFLLGTGKTPDEFFLTQEVEGKVPFVIETTEASSCLASPLKSRVYRQRFKQPRTVSVF